MDRLASAQGVETEIALLRLHETLFVQGVGAWG